MGGLWDVVLVHLQFTDIIMLWLDVKHLLAAAES